MEWQDKPKLLRSVDNVLEFGKHKGEKIADVMRTDPNWLHWALQNIPDFKLNRNALLLLPPFQSTPARRSSIEDGAGGFLPKTFNDYD